MNTLKEETIQDLVDDIIGIANKKLYPFNSDDADRLSMIEEIALKLDRMI